MTVSLVTAITVIVVVMIHVFITIECQAAILVCCGCSNNTFRWGNKVIFSVCVELITLHMLTIVFLLLQVHKSKQHPFRR